MTWNAGYRCGCAARERIDDLAFPDAVIADATGRFGLDPGLVFLTGMSNGSLMAEAYAARRPAAVRAVAGVAGTLDLARFPPKGAGPPAAHSRHSGRPFALCGRHGSEGFTDTDFTPVANVIAAFRKVAEPGLTATRQVIDPADDGIRTVQDDWTDAQARAVVRLLTIEGGGHVWPGGRRADRQGGSTRDITANAEVLRFFDLWR